MDRFVIFCTLGFVTSDTVDHLIVAADVADEAWMRLETRPPSASCLAVLTWMATNDRPSLGSMMLATGQSFPFDAGKWVMCENLPDTKHHIVSVTLQNKQHMEYGICLPSSCKAAEVAQMANHSSNLKLFAFQALFTPEFALVLGGAGVANVTSTSRDDWDARLDKPAPWMAICVCVSLVLLMIISTCFHFIVEQQTARETAERDAAWLEEGTDAQPTSQGFQKCILFRAFSLKGSDGTWDMLWSSPHTKMSTDCLNGLRALSLIWVVSGHSFLYPQGIMGYENPQDIATTPLNSATAENNWLFMFVLNSQLSVDSFFFLGGFLFSLLTLKELTKNGGKMDYVKTLILRYLRLTPSLAFLMLIYYLIWPVLAHGPFAPKFQNSVYHNCDEMWWTELLYIQDFYSTSSFNFCMGWDWYLGNDMTFFVVGLLLVPLYHNSRILGWCAAWILMLGATATMGGLTVVHHLAPEAMDQVHQKEYFFWAYSKPYTRIPPYLVGVMAAWILLRMEERGITAKTGMCGPVVATLLWFFAIGLQTFINFIPATDHGDTANSWSDAADFTYMTFSRTAWAACWAILTFLCYFGHAPLTNWILAHPIWTPFARLTYGAYLFHPMVIKLAAACSEQYYNFSGMDLFYRVSGNILCAFTGSLVVWCLVERPMMTLTTALIKNKSKTNIKPTENVGK